MWILICSLDKSKRREDATFSYHSTVVLTAVPCVSDDEYPQQASSVLREERNAGEQLFTPLKAYDFNIDEDVKVLDGSRQTPNAEQYGNRVPFAHEEIAVRVIF